MTLDAPLRITAAEPAIAWREITEGLWVGRSDYQHAGIIERGRRFTFTDADGVVHPGFESLAAAQEAATGPIPIIEGVAAAPRTRESRRTETLAVVTGLVGGGAIALCGLALTLLH